MAEEKIDELNKAELPNVDRVSPETFHQDFRQEIARFCQEAQWAYAKRSYRDMQDRLLCIAAFLESLELDASCCFVLWDRMSGMREVDRAFGGGRQGAAQYNLFDDAGKYIRDHHYMDPIPIDPAVAAFSPALVALCRMVQADSIRLYETMMRAVYHSTLSDICVTRG